MPRINLFRKILIVSLLLSLLPLFFSSLILFLDLETIKSRLVTEISESSDIQASESLEMRARQVAQSIGDFLRQCENDVRFLANSPLDRATIRNFYYTRRAEVWEHAIPGQREEMRRYLPLYRSIALIDRTGKEVCLISDGEFLTSEQLRNVAVPANTEFKREDYFHTIKQLQQGDMYVGHVTGFHVSSREQLAGATEPERAMGAQYQGVVRFGTPLYNDAGNFNGMIVISLDHRHLMEFTQHISPGKEFVTPFPSYRSGNYAFLFDDEGWIITHPKFWDIRGVDRNGMPVPPYSATSAPADIAEGRIPFNLDHAGFVHPNYPVVANRTREKKSGFVDITNVGKSKKIMAFAPIHYTTGDYSRHGVFGGVTIGFQVDQFHDAARKGSRLISSQITEYRLRSAVILLVTALIAAYSAWRLSRGITHPLNQLADGARKLAAGDAAARVNLSADNEIGELARTFNYMADELENKNSSLIKTLDELRRSRLDIMDERNFKESILESISSAILTFSPAGLLTSINGTGRLFLGADVVVDLHYRQVFQGWGDFPERICQVLSGEKEYGRSPFSIDRGTGELFFETGFFPIGANGEQGLTVTLRNETEKQKLRQEMVRLDRLASLGKLAAGIAHEIRNPLTGISLLLDDLHDRLAIATTGSPHTAADQEVIKRALSEIERVERLITALLNYSAPVRARFRHCDLAAIVSDTILLMKKQCERNSITLHLDTGSTPPLYLDPEQIKQAIINIIRNAIEVMPGGGTISISTSVRDNSHAIISICDTGPGVEVEDIPLIFEPFFTRKGAGTGLGLSITQRIMDEHHGHINVQSSSGHGTCFILEIPLNRTIATE